MSGAAVSNVAWKQMHQDVVLANTNAGATTVMNNENNAAAPPPTSAVALPHKLPELEHFRQQNSPLTPEYFPRTSGFFSQTRRASLSPDASSSTSSGPLPAVSISSVRKQASTSAAPRSNTDSFTLPLSFQEQESLKGQPLPVRLGLAPPPSDLAGSSKYKTRVGHGFYFYAPPPGGEPSVPHKRLSRGSSSGYSFGTPPLSSAATSPDTLTPSNHADRLTTDSTLGSRSHASSSSRSRAGSVALPPAKSSAVPLSSFFNRTSSQDCWRPEAYFNVVHSRVKGKMREFIHHGFPMHQVPYWHGYNKETMDAELATHLNVSLSLKGNTLRPFNEGARPCRVLDLGCGRGAWCLDIAHDWSKSEFIGVDIVPIQPNLKDLNDPSIESRVSWVIANFLEPLPFPDASFDFVHMRFLLQAIPEDKWVDVLSEARRVLAPGGVLEVIEGNYIFFGHASLVDAQDLKDLESGAAASKSGTALKLPRRLKVLRDTADAADIDAIEITLERMMHRRFINPAPLSVIPSNLVIPGFFSIANGNPRHLPVYAESSAQRAKRHNNDDDASTLPGVESSEDESKWSDRFTNRIQMGKQLKSQFKLPDTDLFAAFNIMQSLEYFSSSREIIWQEAEEEKLSMHTSASPDVKPWDHTRSFGQGCVEALRPFAHPWKSKDQFFRALDNYIEAMLAVCDLDFILEKYLGWEQGGEELTVEGRKHAERQRKMSVSSNARSSLGRESSMQQEAQSEEKILALAALRQGAFSPSALAVASKASQEAPARLQTTARMSLDIEDQGTPRPLQSSKLPSTTEKKRRKPSARPSSSAGALGSSTPHSSTNTRVRSFGRGGAGNSALIPDNSSFVTSESFGFSSNRPRKPAAVARTRSIGKAAAGKLSSLAAHTEETDWSSSGSATTASAYAATHRGREGLPASPTSPAIALQDELAMREASEAQDPPNTDQRSIEGQPGRSAVAALAGGPQVGSRSSSQVRSTSKEALKPVPLLGFYDCTGFLAIA